MCLFFILCRSLCPIYMWAVSHTWFWRHHVSEKFQRKSFGPSLRPLSQLEHPPSPPLDKTPPETQSVTFLIRDEPWKQRAASKLCNRSHPLRGKSRVGLSCRREQAMTGLCWEGWWPCIMNGAKYGSAGGAEWRRWRAMGWCQPIGCPRVMHFTLPPKKHSLSLSSPITTPAFQHSTCHGPKTSTWSTEPPLSQIKFMQSLCSQKSAEDD